MQKFKAGSEVHCLMTQKPLRLKLNKTFFFHVFTVLIFEKNNIISIGCTFNAAKWRSFKILESLFIDEQKFYLTLKLRKYLFLV